MGLNAYVRIMCLFFISYRLSVKDKLFVFINSNHLESNNCTLMTLKVLYILEVNMYIFKMLYGTIVFIYYKYL